MRLLRLLFSLAAVIAAVVIGLRVAGEWWGEVYTGGKTAVEGASVILIRSGHVVTTSFTTPDGKFSIGTGKPDTSEHVIVCKKGFEAAIIETRTPRRRRGSDRVQGSVVQLHPDNPDFEPPFVAPLRSVLPSECR